jgi:hypothetical protein
MHQFILDKIKNVWFELFERVGRENIIKVSTGRTVLITILAKAPPYPILIIL